MMGSNIYLTESKYLGKVYCRDLAITFSKLSELNRLFLSKSDIFVWKCSRVCALIKREFVFL